MSIYIHSLTETGFKSNGPCKKTNEKKTELWMAETSRYENKLNYKCKKIRPLIMQYINLMETRNIILGDIFLTTNKRNNS